MNVSIATSELRGTVAAPPSKSYTIRGLMCAALARGLSEIVTPLLSDDTEAAARVLAQIGARIARGPDSWAVQGGVLHEPEKELFCGDSAATLRFMTAICAAVPGECRLTAGKSLSHRPIKPLVDALTQIGVDCRMEEGAVVVRGGGFTGGTAALPGDISSQFVSALLLVSPLAAKGLAVKLTTPPRSEPYIDMTVDCMAQFGVRVARFPDGFHTARQEYRPARYTVEGDWSSAAYFLALGAAGGDITVDKLDLESRQADRAIMDLLQRMGTLIKTEPGSVRVSASDLTAIRADLANCIDLLPTMLALGALAHGASEFTGIARARLKESDRVAAMIEGLNRMGIAVRERDDSLTVFGGRPRGSAIDSHDDHRIAMAFSILGCRAGDTTIKGAESVAKTFPAFWDILRSIGARISTDE